MAQHTRFFPISLQAFAGFIGKWSTIIEEGTVGKNLSLMEQNRGVLCVATHTRTLARVHSCFNATQSMLQRSF